ncbi:MAG: biopolymer transporter ExbD [Verrucomicrobiota bacterium]
MKLESTLPGRSGYLHVGPILDVLLLLLIFFLLNSNVIFRSGISVDPPLSHSVLESMAAADIIAISAGENPRIIWNDEEVDLEGVRTRIERLGEGANAQVVIRGDKKAHLDLVVEIANAAQRAGVDVALSTSLAPSP